VIKRTDFGQSNGFAVLSGPSRPISARLVSCDLIEVFTISSRVAMRPNPGLY
jgi:hypothetical protein